jgi:hypothetical protein
MQIEDELIGSCGSFSYAGEIQHFFLDSFAAAMLRSKQQKLNLLWKLHELRCRYCHGGRERMCEYVNRMH